ncbi:hypothetical protein JL720_3080 [Aureococcus anophagefferens]|nr:hypothetical protein JL720_3080 [Aureococcus anophagefferens]
MAALDDAVTCAICLESTDFAALPCCGTHEGSTTRFCHDCVVLLCDHAGGTGRCPRCRAWISVEDGAIVEKEAMDQCMICRQTRHRDRSMCDAFSGHATNWRLIADDVRRVPDGDAPESWGRRDEWLRSVREYRLRRLAEGPPEPDEGRRCTLS